MHDAVDERFDSARVARLTGLDHQTVVETLKSYPINLPFRRLNRDERDTIVLSAVKENERTDFIRAGRDDPSRWERGWGEVLARVRDRGISYENLRPQYFRYETVRLDGDYARVDTGDFEFQCFQAFLRTLAKRWLTDCDRIVEFGCGTGSNLMLLGETLPDRQLFGCDWAGPSVELLQLIAKARALNLSGARFNMLTCQGAGDLPELSGSACMTLHSMEQLGETFSPFLDFLLASQARICFHIEPLVELYDETALFDALAIRYHRRRNYLSGFVPAVRAAAAAGRAELLDLRRLKLGSVFHEGYSLLIWRPRT